MSTDAHGGTSPPVVLVVDDDPSILALFQIGLPRHGFAARTATSCAAAVELLRREPGHIAAALLDLHLPDVAGAEAVRRLREVEPDLPCCVMSGDRGALSPEELQALGVSDLIPKPFLWADLARRLWACLGTPVPERRRHPRRAGPPVPVEVAPPNGGSVTVTPGEVVDRSPDGLGLAFPGAAPAADRLRVRPPDRPPAEAVDVNVRHRRRRNGGWLLGCEFAAPVGPGLLAAFG
jgi:CheY-like chemotaxis protein